MCVCIRSSSRKSAVKVYLSKDTFDPLKVLDMELYSWDTAEFFVSDFKKITIHVLGQKRRKAFLKQLGKGKGEFGVMWNILPNSIAVF